MSYIAYVAYNYWSTTSDLLLGLTGGFLHLAWKHESTGDKPWSVWKRCTDKDERRAEEQGHAENNGRDALPEASFVLSPMTVPITAFPLPTIWLYKLLAASAACAVFFSVSP
ncbi:hypothetical protein B0H13DRAFT_1875629 [Mycena leptocephala]|nr:hypothetical protein B0H13DRAFT_1875629 [Mycena leptocephala]